MLVPGQETGLHSQHGAQSLRHGAPEAAGPLRLPGAGGEQWPSQTDSAASSMVGASVG